MNVISNIRHKALDALNGARELLYRFRDRHGDWKRAICAAKDHQYPVAVNVGYCLYFCERCGKEICGRTMDELKDMPPIPDDVREQLDMLEEYPA